MSAKTQEKCVQEGYDWNYAICSCENGRYAESIIGNSVIRCDEIIKTTKSILTKTVPTKSTSTNNKEKKLICKMKNFYFLIVFLLITMTLLIAVSIYFFIKY